MQPDDKRLALGQEEEEGDDAKRPKRSSVKDTHYFDFTDKLDPKEKEKVLEEEGLLEPQLDKVASYVILNTAKQTKKRRSLAKAFREIALFWTTKSYYLFHMAEVILFWIIVVIFPWMQVMGCELGHHWMTHVAMGMYLILALLFDFVFCS